MALLREGSGVPAKVFEVKGGSVQLQGGLLGLKDQLLLIVIVGNNTGRSMWTQVEVRQPNGGQLLQDVHKVDMGGTSMFRWPVPAVSYDVEYPFTVSVYEDDKRTKPLGGTQEAFFFASGPDRESFEKARPELPPGRAMATNGLRGLPESAPEAEVQGTMADSVLQRDITQKLFAEASKFHKDCEHRVLKAEPYGEADRSTIATAIGDKGLELEKRLRARNEMAVERWFVKSCETEDSYEVVLMKSGTRTDIMVKRLGP